MATHRARLMEYEDIFNCAVIPIKSLRKLCFAGGCPHEKSIRSTCWKILLNYLPLQRSDWENSLKAQRKSYQQFIDDIIVQPGREKYDDARADVTMEDHPLNPNPTSQWSQFFKDNETLLQIDKDCRRLYPDLSFFQMATAFPCVELADPHSDIESLRCRVARSVIRSQNVAKNRSGMAIADVRRSRPKSQDDYSILPDGKEAHWEVCERILFLYAKLNPGQSYVQGMNEILGPIYYTFASDTCGDSQEFAEADAFWCFTNLMSEIRDIFIKSLDDSFCGIGHKMNHLMSMVKEKDTPLWLCMNKQQLQPQFFAFRWLTLLLSQEFPLPDVLRLWDSLIADSSRFDYLLYVACAMLLLVRNEMLNSDFPTNMKLLQNYPVTDINVILRKATELYER